MTTFVNQQIPPPTNWQDFEKLCADLWTRIWNDPNTQMHGRQGQPQYGVDVYGRPNQDKDYAGVQCKGKDAYNHKEVTETDLKKEVNKAKEFEPKISHFILATTAPNDEKIQKVARKITEQHKKDGLFDVVVFGWDEIQRRIADYPDLIDKHYPYLGPTQHKIASAVDNIEQSLNEHEDRDKQRKQEILSAITALPRKFGVFQDSDSESKDSPDEALNAQIDEYRILLNSHQVKVSLELLEKLKQRVWDSSSDNIKFRIATNIAAAKSRLDHMDEAAKEFIEAAQYNPSDEKAACNIAFSHLLIHEDQKAKEAAEKAIQEHPDCDRAYSLFIASLIDDTTVVDPTDHIPAEQCESAEVAYSLAHWFHHRGQYSDAHEWMERALSKDEKNIEVRMTAGGYVLEPLFQEQAIIQGGLITDEQGKQIERARELLSGVWNEIKETDEAARYIHVATNWVNLERLVGEVDKAKQIIDEALHVDSDSNELKRLKTIIELQNGNYEEALSLSGNIDCKQYKDVIMMQAEAFFELGRYDEALLKVNEFIGEGSQNDVMIEAFLLRLHIIRKTKGTDSAIEEGNKLLTRYTDNVRILSVLSELYKTKGNKEQSNIILNNAKSKLTKDTPYRECKIVADALFYSERYQEAMQIYEELKTTCDASDALRNFLICLMELDQRHKILTVFEELKEEVKSLPFYRKMLAAVYQRIGKLFEARKHYEAYLEQCPNDLNVRLAWIEIAEKLHDQHSVVNFLDKRGNYDHAKPEDIVRLSHVLYEHGRIDEALVLAYENRRKYFDNSAAHFGYVGLLLFQSRKIPQIDNVIQVAVDTAFTLEDKDGNRDTYIIESSSERNRQVGELSPEDPIAVNALGKANGNDVVVSENYFQKDMRKIVSIKHKYLHALHESMERFQELFPENKNLMKCSLRKSQDPQEQFEPIFESLSQRQEFINQAEELYLSNRLPLGILANFVGSHPIDVWRSFMGRRKIPFNVCMGTLPEREQAFQLIEDNQNRYIIDPVTLFSICTVKVQESIIAVTGKLGITQSTLDMLNYLIDQRKISSERGHLSLFKEGEQYYKLEVTKEDIERDINQIKEVISWTQSYCEILPAVGTQDIPVSGLEIRELMDSAFIDSVLAAQGTGRLLLSDDMHLRILCQQMFNVNGVWLQPVLMTALDRGHITRERYNEVIVLLVNTNYFFISIDANVLLYLAKIQDWKADKEFERVASTLSGEHTDLISSLTVAMEFLARLWELPIWILYKENFLYMILNILTKGRGEQLMEILEIFRKNVGRIQALPKFVNRINQTQYQEAITKWCEGHFIRF